MRGTLEFVWAVGEESSDPLVPYGGQLVRVDQMYASGHLDRIEQDLAAVAGVGAAVVRYGVNWRRAQPEEGVFDWSLWDRALAAADQLGLHLIVDLMHHGVPDWLAGAGDPRLPEALLRYTESFLRRYPQPRWFVPVHEPYLTAHMSARLGRWNEAVHDDASFIHTLARLCLAELTAAAAIRADRRAGILQPEVFGMDVTAPGSGGLDTARANARRMISFDLRYGVEPLPAAAPLLDMLGDDLRWRLSELATTVGVVAGHDFFPTSVAAGGPSYSTLARSFHARYGVRFMVSQTSNLGWTPEMAPAWLEELFEDVCQLRAEGYPCMGICWSPRGDSFDWASCLTEPVGELTPVGLFTLDRDPRPAAAKLRDLMARPVPEVPVVAAASA